MQAKDITRAYELATFATRAREDLEARHREAQANATARRQAVAETHDTYVATVLAGGDAVAAKRAVARATAEADLAALVPRGFGDQIEALHRAEIKADQEAGAAFVAAAEAVALARKEDAYELFRQGLAAFDQFTELAYAANREAERVGLANTEPVRWEFLTDEVRDVFASAGVIEPHCIEAWYRIDHEAPTPASRDEVLRAFEALAPEQRDIEPRPLAVNQGLRVAKRVAREQPRPMARQVSADGWNEAPDDDNDGPQAA